MIRTHDFKWRLGRIVKLTDSLSLNLLYIVLKTFHLYKSLSLKVHLCFVSSCTFQILLELLLLIHNEPTYCL